MVSRHTVSSSRSGLLDTLSKRTASPDTDRETVYAAHSMGVSCSCKTPQQDRSEAAWRVSRQSGGSVSTEFSFVLFEYRDCATCTQIRHLWQILAWWLYVIVSLQRDTGGVYLVHTVPRVSQCVRLAQVFLRARSA